MARFAARRRAMIAHRSPPLPARCGGYTRALGAALAVGACVPSAHLSPAQASSPLFDPVAFFAGHTEGRGSLEIVLRHRRTTLVEGHGVVTPAGGIDLEQIVRSGNAQPTHRTWHLRRTVPGHYTGSLSEARGPVTGDVVGNRLHLRFNMKGGLHVDQWLYLQPGGQTARNRMVVTKLGVPVASLDEVIARQPS